MTLTIHLFARAKELLGDRVQLELPPAATVGDLRARLALERPTLAALVASSLVAVNHDFADDSQVLRSTDEIALIPPVSGG